MMLRATILCVLAVLNIAFSNAMHEVGHFIACRLLRCKLISLRIFPHNFSWNKTNVQYSVSLKGQNHCAFRANRRWQVIVIVLAGSFVDLLLGIIFLLIFFNNNGLWIRWAYLLGGVGDILSIIYNLMPSTNGDGKLLQDAWGGQR